MLIRNSLSPETIEVVESTPTAADVIRLLSERIAQVAGLDSRRIEKAVLEREQTRTTAFSNGAALPHCRLADLSKFVTGLALFRKPLRWDADGHAVDRVMLIAGPVAAVSDHLRILANGSQILDSPSIHNRLRTVPDAHSAFELIAAAEEAIEARRSHMGILTEVRREGAEDKDYLRNVADQFEW